MQFTQHRTEWLVWFAGWRDAVMVAEYSFVKSEIKIRNVFAIFSHLFSGVIMKSTTKQQLGVFAGSFRAWGKGMSRTGGFQFKGITLNSIICN